MGAKKRRQGVSWQDQRLPDSSVTQTKVTNEQCTCPELYYSNHKDSKCSSCNVMSTHPDTVELNTIDNRLSANSCLSLCSFSNLFSHPTQFISSGKSQLVVPIIILLIASSSIVQVESVCVWQGGGGFRVACGFRQSGLFRLRSIGGVKGYVGAGFTIGDEDGFKDSLTNTEGQNQQQQHGYLPQNVHTQRSLPPGSQTGNPGEFSQNPDHAVPTLPMPSGDPNSQKLLQTQYLHGIQDQMINDQQNIEHLAIDQRNQKMLEQQMYMQGGMVPPLPPSPTPPAKVKGLTKRASLWNWPNIFNRGKNQGKNKPKKKPKNHDYDGPPSAHHQHGPPPANRRGGRPNGRNGGPPEERFREKGGRRGPPPRPPKDFRHEKSDAFMRMKNPFSHLQDSQETRRSKINHGQNYVNKNFASGQDRFPPQPPSHEDSDYFGRQQPEGNDRQIPQTLMLPPASAPMNIPKFKKLPNNLKQKERESHERHRENPRMESQQQPPIDRMMTEPHDGPSDYYASPEHQLHEGNADPAGLKMLKRTQNFGNIFHLVNPDGSPVNMQFEKQPVLPPGIQFSSQQQQDLAEELLRHQQHQSDPGLASPLASLGEEGLATAVYDPNIFPDIYFTTTEKHTDPLQNHNLLALSHEMLDNPLVNGNHLKRILGSDEKPSKRKLIRKKPGVSPSQEEDTTQPRRKMRRRKKFRLTNQVDTVETETTGSDSSALPKRRRKGRRKKYKLQTAKTDETMASSTERMGLPVEGEQSSLEMNTESPTIHPLTTTPQPYEDEEDFKPTKNKSGEKLKNKSKTSFSLPSSEDEQLTGPAAPFEKDMITSTGRTTSEETTTKYPMSYSTFGYYDAVRGAKENAFDDYESFSGPSGDEFFRSSYDPRFPPDHEVNRGHNMTKFIRPRGPTDPVRTLPTTSTTMSPFILYDMTGTRNQSRFSSRFHKDSSPFKLDTDQDEPLPEFNGFGGNPHPFYANSQLAKDEKGIFVKFDSREWGGDKKSHDEDPFSDPFDHRYNKTQTNSGYFDNSKEFRPSIEIPTSLLAWERKLSPSSTSAQPPPPSPVYPSYSHEVKPKYSLTVDTFGFPGKPTTTPYSPESGESKRKLHQNLFGGSSADVTDTGDWASPNFWGGSVQDAGRYGPKTDLDTNNNLKRLLDFGSPNGLKEMDPVDLSSPTPIPMPSPSPGLNTAEDMDSPDYLLSPSTPGRWGKPKKRKGKPTPEPVKPTPVPLIMSSSTARMSSSTTPVPSKWLAVMSNELDMPSEYYDNSAVSPASLSLELEKKSGKGKKKSGIEIKFKSGEERDPEEEDAQQSDTKIQQFNITKGGIEEHMEMLGFPSGASGFPGVMVHDFDTSQGYGFGEVEMNRHSSPPTPPRAHSNSEISFYPIVNENGEHSDVPVSFSPFGPNNNQGRPVFPGTKKFVPSIEDVSQEPPSGMPSHQDNPFKGFEKQNMPVRHGGHGMGFVSANQEFKEMEHQIQKFSNSPGDFTRRDSSEKMRDHSPHHNGDHQPEFNGPPPPTSSMNIPGFVNIGLPDMHESALNMHNRDEPPHFSPSGYPPNDSEQDKSPFMEHAPPNHHDREQGPSLPPPGFKNQDAPWDYRPLEHNDVNEIIPPNRPPVESTTRHPVLHLDLVNGPPNGGPGPSYGPPDAGHGPSYGPPDAGNGPSYGPPPPRGPPHGGQGPPVDSDELRHERLPPAHGRDNDFRQPPPGPLRIPPKMRDEFEKHLGNGPMRFPPLHEEHERPPPPRFPPGGPPNKEHNRPPPREDRGRPPPHLRDQRPHPPPGFEFSPRVPPPNQRERERNGDRRPQGNDSEFDNDFGPPREGPHYRDGPPRGPPREGPPHLREGPPPHLREGPPHFPSREGPPPRHRDGPPHLPPRDGPNHPREGPPPHFREGPPHHPSRDGPPPHHRDEPPHYILREGPPHHPRDGPPHIPPREGPPHHPRNNPPHIPPREDSPPQRDTPPHIPPRDGPPNQHRNQPPREGPPPPGRPPYLPPREDSPPSGRPPYLPPREDAPPRGESPNRGPHPHPKIPLPPRLPEPQITSDGMFYPPTKEDSLRFDHDRRNFLDRHKVIENLRPPASKDKFRDNGHFERGDPSNIDSWQDEHLKESHRDSPHHPPIPQGMPDYLDLQKIPHDKRPPHPHPFNSKPPGLKKPLPPHPTKIPHQVFKPPPPPKKHPGNFFSNMLTGPFGKPNKPPKSPHHQLPPPPHHRHPPHRKPALPPVEGPEFSLNPFNDPPSREHHFPGGPPNYINPHNDRFEPPPPPFIHGKDEHKPNRPLPPPFSQNPEEMPFLPFPGDSFESKFAKPDKNAHAQMVPTRHDDASLPVRPVQKPQPTQPPTPVYPSSLKKPTQLDEKAKVMAAFDTLNKANYDVIQSLAADKYGPGFIDKLKTKSNIMYQEPSMHHPQMKIDAPVVTANVTPSPIFNMNMFASLTTKSPGISDETAKLTELLKMLNKPKPVASALQQQGQAMAASSHVTNNAPASDPIASLLKSLSKPVSTPATMSTTRTPEMPSNPGLVSLTSLNQTPGDIKSLQAHLAKAIIAKAHHQSDLEKPHYQPINISASTKDSPLAVLQQLALSRQAQIQATAAAASPKNYTASQIETLKKLIALNNIEQKLGGSPSPQPSENVDPLSKLKALLPAAMSSPPSPSAFLPANTITRKMLDIDTANALSHSHNNNLLQNPTPTILALKAIALSKAQGVNPQPSISLPQQVKPTEPSSPPIAVDLSAILSPSPPVIEVNRKRRLTNVRNAPKSFYPANATQGFEDSMPLVSEFQCNEQSFFPGLYADAELGCRVFHLCAKTDAGYMMKSFRCPKETVFDQEVLRCNWNLFVDCPASKNKYHFNKYLSQSFQFLKILGEFSANIQKSDATMTG